MEIPLFITGNNVEKDFFLKDKNRAKLSSYSFDY
jgi:hypothetical protein